MLKIQIVQDGKNRLVLPVRCVVAPAAAARKMEPATLSGMESAQRTEIPDDYHQSRARGHSWHREWFEVVGGRKITGLIKTNVNGKTSYEPDAASTEVYWARFYDLQTNKPLFPGRDGVIYDTFAAMAAKNKLGYDYYSPSPAASSPTARRSGARCWREPIWKIKP